MGPAVGTSAGVGPAVGTAPSAGVSSVVPGAGSSSVVVPGRVVCGVRTATWSVPVTVRWIWPVPLESSVPVSHWMPKTATTASPRTAPALMRTDFRRGRAAAGASPSSTTLVLPCRSGCSGPLRENRRWATVAWTFFRPCRLFSSDAL